MSTADVMVMQQTSVAERSARYLRLFVLGAVVAGCASTPGGRGPGDPDGGPAGPQDAASRRGDLAAQSDQLKVLQGLGLFANGIPMPFTGSVAMLPGPVADSTYVVLSLSMPTQAFAFSRENDRFKASYVVAVEARANGSIVSRVESNQTVRVMSFKETQRSDESVLFQQQMLLPPGKFMLSVLVRDASSSRSGTQEREVTVPRFGGQPGTPIIVLEVNPRTNVSAPPDLLASSRSTIVLGRDTELPLYLEVRDTASAGVPLQIRIRDDKGVSLFQDSVVLPKRGNLASNLVRIPVSGLGVGVVQAAVWRTGQTDTVTQPVLISFGDDLPVTSFDEMIGYLRFFASTSRLNTLRSGTPQQRATAWAALLRETDPISSTPQNEALRDYFQRIRSANERFREEGSGGWFSDRGATYVALGEPTQVLELNTQGGQQSLSVGQRGRLQAWEYPDERLRIIFVDQSGFGRWRFYGSGAADFQTALQRRLNR
jgi:GWxTD domain-containing protein